MTMIGDPRVTLLTAGPYAGRHWVVTKAGEPRIKGAGRQPYYGHIEHVGRHEWRATIPGGYLYGNYPTRRAAAAALIAAGRSP